MTATIDLAGWRLRNQRLTGSRWRSAADVVAWLGAMQAQDYPGARWAIGLRAQGLHEKDVEDAFNRGAILRTHVMRPTWHFITPADIRWLLALTAPRVHAMNGSMYRKVGLDDRVAAKCRTVLERALRGGRHLTRTELAAHLERASLPSAGQGLAYVMMRAELDQVVCSGPRHGRQFTYALFDERVPSAPARAREAALAELARRYVASHGPATVRDLAWWSGLTQRDARLGMALAGPSLETIEIAGRTCWFIGAPPSGRAPRPTAHLVPNYDEYLIAHQDRDLIPRLATGSRDVFPHHVIVSGRLAGSWRRLDSGAVRADVNLYRGVPPDTAGLVAAAAARYQAFVTRGAGRGLS